MKIAYTLWTWLMDEHNEFKPYTTNQKGHFEQSLREVSNLGFKFFENFNLLVELYDGEHNEFDELCDKYGMTLVNIYHYLKEDYEQDFKLAEKCCQFLKKHDANLMNLQAPWTIGPRGSHPTKEEVTDTIKKVNEIGKMSKDYGVTTCFHPHFGTVIYYEEDIDRAYQEFNPEIKLCMDTAHTKLAGMTVQDKFREIGDRIGYVHFKDVCESQEYSLADQMFRFRVLGLGTIDFAEVHKALKDIKYDGYVCFEQDYQRVCNYETALTARNYLHQIGLM